MKTKQKLGKAKKATLKKKRVTAKITKSRVIREIIVHKDLKYLYPEDCTDPLARKEFRRKVRNELTKLEAQMNQLTGSDKERIGRILLRKRRKYLADISAKI